MMDFNEIIAPFLIMYLVLYVYTRHDHTHTERYGYTL